MGTAAAFAITERLKLVPSPIVAPKLAEAFSPACGCATRAATIEFRLRKPDRVTLTIIDGANHVVGNVVDGESLAGTVRARWAPSPGTLPDGRYRARVHLTEARRTIVIPNPMQLDTKRPSLRVSSVAPRVFSPEGDGRADKVKVAWSASEEVRVRLLADGRRAVESPPRRRGTIDWYARRERPGRHTLSVVATDLAGNRSPVSAPALVRLRFIVVRPPRIVVPAGVRFGVAVSTDATRYGWRLGRRRGRASGGALVLRAPTQPGSYVLRVFYDRKRDAIPVVVRPR